MQLVLALAIILLFSGKSGGKRRIPEISTSEVADILRYVSNGNEQMDKIIKEAEQVSEIISSLAPLAEVFAVTEEGAPSAFADDADGASPEIGLYLKPISGIADNGIYNALSGAMA